ncbi:MAG TPA: ferredoxin [Actinotalea sp.]|nr:ferredoxin [Actinotalea sp.]
MSRGGAQGAVLRVDPLLCEGVGVCARIAPDAVDLDRWGYPVVGPLEPGQSAAARRAVRGCPRRALWLEDLGVRA